MKPNPTHHLWCGWVYMGENGLCIAYSYGRTIRMIKGANKIACKFKKQTNNNKMEESKFILLKKI